MPRLRTVRTKEEADKVPVDQAINIEVGPADDAPLTVDLKKETAAETPAKVETPESPRDEDREALRKQLDDLRTAEKLNIERAVAEAERRVRDQYVRQIRDVEGERDRSREDVLQAQHDTIINGLAAAKAEGDAAQRDLETAQINGDYKASADAGRRISRAESKVAQFEDRQAAVEAAIEEKKSAPPQKLTDDPFEAQIANLPDSAKSWLRQHPSYMTDAKKNRQIQYLHDRAEEKNLEPFSSTYFEFIETELGLRQRAAVDESDDDEPAPRMVVSAPPSKETHSMSSGKTRSSVTLTPEHREFARISGIGEVEYARQLLELERRKKTGHYDQ